MSDASRIVEIESSPAKMLGLFGLGVLMTAGAVAIAVPLLPGLQPNALMQVFGYSGGVFFGFCTAVAGWRLLTTRGPVVTITPDGIRDTRVAAEFIPWSAVHRISTWEVTGQKVMVLAVDEAVEGRLTLTSVARWSRGANRALGADGLCITAQGLKIAYPTLFKISVDHLHRTQSTALRE
jgi:hypothetical protein